MTATVGETFRLDLIRWLNEWNDTNEYGDLPRHVVTVDLGIRLATIRAIDEVKEDIKSGLVPEKVSSFAELHDYVDANGYGGAFFWPELASEKDSAYQDAHA